jgi:cytochrome c oxidase subunit 2
MTRRLVWMTTSLLLISGLEVASHLRAAEDAPKRIQVTATRFAFTPAEVTLKEGDPVVFVLTSGDVAHGLRFRELNFNIRADKGKTAEMELNPNKVGTFVGHCSVFCGSGHGEMTLMLHVVN